MRLSKTNIDKIKTAMQSAFYHNETVAYAKWIQHESFEMVSDASRIQEAIDNANLQNSIYDYRQLEKAEKMCNSIGEYKLDIAPLHKYINAKREEHALDRLITFDFNIFDPFFLEIKKLNEKRYLVDRAKQMIMGNLQLDQYLYQNTQIMLPAKHQMLITPLLQLFRDVIIVDVFNGDRAAICFLADKEFGLPIVSKYVIQFATIDGETNVGALCKEEVTETYKLGKNRTHVLNEFPKRFFKRIMKIAGGTDAFDKIWKDYQLVFIWEREPADDLAELIRYIA